MNEVFTPDPVRKIPGETFMFLFGGGLLLAATGWWNVPVAAYLGLLLFGLFLFRLFKLAPTASLLLLPASSLLRLTELISGIAIEHGAFLTETNQLGMPTGGFLRLALLDILFTGVAAYIIERLARQWNVQGMFARFAQGEARFTWLAVGVLNALVAVQLLYLLYVGIGHGFPLLTGDDRFAFRIALADPIYTSVMGNRYLMVLYLGAMNAVRIKGHEYKLAALAVLVISALFGEKFTSITQMLLLFGVPLLLARLGSGKAIPFAAVARLGVLLALVSLPLIFVVYGGLHHSGAALDRMGQRMALQGQLWFLADYEATDFAKFETAPLANDARLMTALSPDASMQNYPFQGMNYLVVRFTDPLRAYVILKTGVVYALGTYAYLLETLGWVGVIVGALVLAVLLGGLLAGLLYALLNMRLVHFLVFAKLYTFWMAMLTTADLFYLFNLKSVALLAALLLYELFGRFRRQQLERLQPPLAA